MPRYSFDIRDDGKPTRDDVGADFASDDEARLEAIGPLPLLMRDAMPEADGYEVSVAVRDAQGCTIYEARMSLHGRWLPGQR